MDFNFTEEQLLLRDTIRNFCKKELTKQYVRWLDENVSFIPQELWDKIAELGYFGIRIPKEYGGAGMTFTDYIVACEELATASTAVAFCAGLSQDFGGDIISRLGTSEQKKDLLPRIAAGQLKFCLALTEPAGGTDILGALKTTAIKQGDSFILNGQKVFITGAHVADYILVIAITDLKAAKRSRALSIFIVDAKTPGITVVPIRKLGIHACGANEIFLDNVSVPEENVLGELNKGWSHLLEILNPERIITSVFSLGVAKAAFQDAMDYSLQRYAFGKPIGQFQIIQHYLVDMAIAIENARNLIYKCCWLYEQGKPVHVESTMAKIVAGYASEIAAIKGLEIFGGWGYTMEYDIQRYFRDYKQMIFAPIADEMAKNMLGEWMGLPRSF
ncbi:MAG: acyl-CoA/acyl-ACP dehydrogenase [Dehalococcoidia bacterium]|jgi:acyl-CoA dehydrogenase|nr:acyl-CoA/acyl-ACP dehydrogenase [Dehalococcoidia bacterium]